MSTTAAVFFVLFSDCLHGSTSDGFTLRTEDLIHGISQSEVSRVLGSNTDGLELVAIYSSRENRREQEGAHFEIDSRTVYVHTHT